MTGTREILIELASGDACSLRQGLALGGEDRSQRSGEWCLDHRTRALVQFAALLAMDANTTSLRWAADRALAVGVRDQALVRVLLTTGWVAGVAQAVSAAPRLGLALDLDIEIDGWDGT